MPDEIGRAVAEHMPQQMTLRETVREVHIPANLPVQSVQNAILNDFEREIETEMVQERRAKPSKKLMETVEWIIDNDEDMEMKVRDAAVQANVSVGTMQNARDYIRARKITKRLK